MGLPMDVCGNCYCPLGSISMAFVVERFLEAFLVELL